MCAIAGILRGKEATAFPVPEKILSTMQRRGPDSEGVFTSEEENPLITLYHARLAVIADVISGFREKPLCNCL